MANPEYQAVSAAGAPPVVTPADTPSDPSGYASVTPHGQGPAPYSITAPLDDLAGAANAAGAIAGAGIVYPQGSRQAATAALLDSVQGFSAGGGTSGYDITPGYSGSSDDPGDGWPNDPQPVILETPIQGMGSNQANTGTD
jgi:hypothetical protein